MTQQEKAQHLRHLHRPGDPLVVANAYDVSSARIFEEAGFPVIATSSAGVANVLGFADGERIPLADMLDMVRRIARACAVPVTADMEGGYGDVVATARGIVEAGAVGFNYEDGRERPTPHLIDIDEMCAGIRGAVEEGRKRGVDLVINARTDAYLRGVIPPDQCFDESVRRAKAYIEAGAACAFIPGVKDEQTIAALVKAISAPINILAVAGAPPIARLRELGVARVSIGSGPARAAQGLVKRIAEELRDHGTYRSMTEGGMNFLEANAMFLPELK